MGFGLGLNTDPVSDEQLGQAGTIDQFNAGVDAFGFLPGTFGKPGSW